MAHKHRIIYNGSHFPFLGELSKFFVTGGLFRQLRGELVDRLLTWRQRPRSSLKAYLRLVNLELTNYCNQRCRYCATGLNNNKRPRGKLDLATFKKVVADLPPTAALFFAGFGEPFLHEQLEEFLEYAAVSRLAARLDIYSNFGPPSEERIRHLLDQRFRRLIITLDSLDRQTFIEQKGVDEFEKVFNNIKVLADEVKQRKRLSQHIIVQMIVTKKTLDERQKFIETITALNLEPRLKKLNVHSPRLDENKIREFEVPELSRYSHQGYSRRCEWLWGGLQVYWNGDVSICCQDPTGLSTYGNVLQASPRDLLNSDAGRCEFRRQYFEDPGQIAICRTCDIA